MKTAAEISVVELKRCPRCEESLPISEFGICRSRKDGRNLYCKRCIRQKISQSRQALREYKQGRRSADLSLDRSVRGGRPGLSSARIARILRKMGPAEKVREAIRCGARTQREIAQITRLPKDEIGDALANLLLWSREIRTEVISNSRMYFINIMEEQTDGAPNRTQKGSAEKGTDLNPSFSSVHDLMPGRKPYAKGRKRASSLGKARGQGGITGGNRE